MHISSSATLGYGYQGIAGLQDALCNASDEDYSKYSLYYSNYSTGDGEFYITALTCIVYCHCEGFVCVNVDSGLIRPDKLREYDLRFKEFFKEFGVKWPDVGTCPPSMFITAHLNF